MRACPCVCARVSPHPPLQTSPPSPPSLSLSHPLSCAHSLIPSRAEKAGRAAPRSGTPVLKLTHAAGRPANTLRATGGGRGGVMEMVHQAIYSLPQYGFSDLLSSHQGNKHKRLLPLFFQCVVCKEVYPKVLKDRNSVLGEFDPLAVMSQFLILQRRKSFFFFLPPVSTC